MADGSHFRDQVLVKYGFTRDASELLKSIPLEIDSPETDRGGGFWYPNQRRIFLYGAQDEACLHELAHAWADESGFYTEPHPEDPSRNARHYFLREDVRLGADETDVAYRRVAFLCWEYTYGNPMTGFEGMREADWERFAGLASGVMGDISLMPPYIRRWYTDLFTGNPMIPGPAELPGWAPTDWRPGMLPRSELTLGEVVWERLYTFYRRWRG